MEVVAGLTLKNLRPRVWDPAYPSEHLTSLTSVMLSFEEFRQRPRLRRQAVEHGLRYVLGLERTDSGPERPLRIYLDNGAFACLRDGHDPDVDGFRQFVAAVRPAWYPVPADFIPLPTYSRARQRALFERTLAVLEAHAGDGFCPVVHPGPWLGHYLETLQRLGQTRQLALGGLVPHLLNSPGAQRLKTIALLRRIRREFPGRIHAFGIGGVVTLHLAAALGVDSADSSGWRQRAARGLVVLRGRGERQAVRLGSWQGRALSANEWQELERCRCPCCRTQGPGSLSQRTMRGFIHRAVHNLWVLLQEAALINRHLERGDFATWSLRRVCGNAMGKLVAYALECGA